MISLIAGIEHLRFQELADHCMLLASGFSRSQYFNEQSSFDQMENLVLRDK